MSEAGAPARRRLGETSVCLPKLGLGCAPFGELRELISEAEAERVLDAAWASGVRYFDTAPWYGRGLSELRLGRLLRTLRRADFTLSTKVGRTFHRPRDPAAFQKSYWSGGLDFDHRFDYTYDGIMRSYEQSLMRLGVNTIDLLLIHDLEPDEHGSQQVFEHHLTDLERSGWRALEMLRRSGEVRAVGAGVNVAGMIELMLERFDLDFFLVAMPYTLLDQSALEIDFPRCEARGAGVIVGSPYASGILATGARHPAPIYNYEPASAEILSQVRRIEEVCALHDVDLRAAALQFPLRHPCVASVLAGAFVPHQTAQNLCLVEQPIPPAFWQALRDWGLVHPAAP